MCRNIETNPDFLRCEEEFEQVYTECTASCGIGEYLCISTCVREYEYNMDTCPCKSDCPHGCPCPGYECQSTTTPEENLTSSPAPIRETVLVLSTYNMYTVPLLTDSEGRDDRNFFFMYGEATEAYHSCGLTFQNEFYMFGGWSHKTQISKITKCRLERVGSLTFDLRRGG